MLFELVEMICIRIIKGKLMKISKKYMAYLQPFVLFVQSFMQAAAINCAESFQKSHRFSFLY